MIGSWSNSFIVFIDGLSAAVTSMFYTDDTTSYHSEYSLEVVVDKLPARNLADKNFIICFWRFAIVILVYVKLFKPLAYNFILRFDT